MKPSQLIQEVSQDANVLAYQEHARQISRQYSWFRRVILDPIIKPLLEELFQEYLEVIVRATIDKLSNGGK